MPFAPYATFKYLITVDFDTPNAVPISAIFNLCPRSSLARCGLTFWVPAFRPLRLGSGREQ